MNRTNELPSEPLSDERLDALRAQAERLGDGSAAMRALLDTLELRAIIPTLLGEIASGRAATLALAVLQEALPPLRAESERLAAENEQLRAIARTVAAIRETGTGDALAPYDAQISALTIQQARDVLAASRGEKMDEARKRAHAYE